MKIREITLKKHLWIKITYKMKKNLEFKIQENIVQYQ